MTAERNLVFEAEQYLSSGDETLLPDSYERKETSLPGGGFQGLYTKRELHPGYAIGIYVGDLIHVAEANRRKDFFTQDHRWNEAVYLFDVTLTPELIRDKWSSMFAQSPFLREQYSKIGMPKSFVIDGYRNGSFVRYTNATFVEHDINCRFVQREEYVYLVVTRHIPAGGELLTTYGEDTDSIIYANPSVPLTTAGESKMFDMMVGRSTGRVGSIPWIKRIGPQVDDHTSANQFLVQMYRSSSELGEHILIEPAEDPRKGFVLYKTDLIEHGFLVIERSGRYLNLRFKNINNTFYDESYPNGRYRMVIRINGGQKPGVYERHFIIADTEQEAARYIPGAPGNTRPAVGVDEETLYNYRLTLDSGTAWSASSRSSEMDQAMEVYIQQYQDENRRNIEEALHIRNKAMYKIRKSRSKRERYGGWSDYRGGDPTEEASIREVTLDQLPSYTYQMQPLPRGPGLTYRPQLGIPLPPTYYTEADYAEFQRNILTHLSTEQQVLEYHAERVRRYPEARERYEQMQSRAQDREEALYRPRVRARRRPFRRQRPTITRYANEVTPRPKEPSREEEVPALGPQVLRFLNGGRRRREEEEEPPARQVRRRLEEEKEIMVVSPGVGIETYEWRRENVMYADADKTEAYEMDVDGMALATLRNGGPTTLKPLVPIEVLQLSLTRLPGQRLVNLQPNTCTYYGIPVYIKSVTSYTNHEFFVSIEDVQMAGLMTPADTYTLLGTEQVVIRRVNEVTIDADMVNAIEPEVEVLRTLHANMAPNLSDNSYSLTELQKAMGRPIGAERFSELWEYGVFYSYVSVNFPSVQFGPT